MTEGPQIFEIATQSLGDETCALNLIGLPGLQLSLQASDGEIEKRIGQPR